jgi:hypothetical protein
MGESQHPDQGSGMNNPDHIFLELRNHFFAFWGVKILKFFDEDPGSGMETVRIRDPGWKKVGSGIRDKHPGSATLHSGKSELFLLICINASLHCFAFIFGSRVKKLPDPDLHQRI